MSCNKIPIRNLSKHDIEDILIKLSEKTYRANQILNWIWKNNVTDFDKFNNIPDKTIDFLKSNYCFDNIKYKLHKESNDGTIKFLFSTYDNNVIESVIIKSKKRLTACISTQVGCSLACEFCQSGKSGFERDLHTGEIFDQLFYLNEFCKENYDSKISNIVIMGMGEPLLNYDNTIMVIKHLSSSYSLNMSPQRITLSTSGISPVIKKLAEENLNINLAISLHTTINKKRDLIMPVNKKYNIESLKEAIKFYYNKTQDRITYEYILLKNFNDSISDAVALTEFTKITPCKINLIDYNETDESIFNKTSDKKKEKFYEYLISKNLIVNIRKSKGSDINAACGQLAKKSKDI